MFPAVGPESKTVGPNSPIVVSLRKELQKTLLQVADLQQQVQKERDIAHKAQQRNLGVLPPHKKAETITETTTEFLQKWSCAAPDETVHVQRVRSAMDEVGNEKAVKSQGKRSKDEEIQRLNNSLTMMRRKFEAEQVASGKWKTEMQKQEKLNRENQRYIKRLEDELHTFKHIQAMEDKREARKRQKALQHERNIQVAKLREAQWHREVESARTAANAAGESYVTPRKPKSFYPGANEIQAAKVDSEEVPI